MINASIIRILIILLISLPAGLMGCERSGPLERAGEKVDDAADDVKKSVEDAEDRAH
jgi:predicted small lipoprotein YifL